MKGSYVISRSLVQKLAPEATILHPLPRVDEIKPNVDPLPGAAYFRQAANGVWARMALLALVLDAATVGVEEDDAETPVDPESED